MIENLFTVSALLGALGIFFLRVLDMTLDTLRVLFVMRGKHKLVWLLGFAQSMIFVVAITSVLSNLDNPLNLVGYAAGFATGNVVGMFIEGKLAVGFIHLTIVSSRRGNVLAEVLRDNGFPLTEIPARGRDGTVSVIYADIPRKEVKRVEKLIYDADPEAYITEEDVRPRRRSMWRA